MDLQVETTEMTTRINPAAVTPLSGLRAAPSRETAAAFHLAGHPLDVTVYAPGILRLRLGRSDRPDYGLLAAPPDPRPLTTTTADGVVRLDGGDIQLEFSDNPLHFVLRRHGQPVLRSITDGHFTRPHRLPPFARTDRGWIVSLNLDSGEPVYGLGEKFGPLNHRGQLITSWVQDALGVNAEISYKNCPFAWSPAGWGLFVHTPGRVTHGVGYGQWSHRSYVVEVEDDALDLFLLWGDKPAEILERYTWLTGRAPRPPRWSYGVWLSRAYYRDAEEALAAARAARKKGYPCDVLTLDGRAWLDTETRFSFEWDPKRYPKPAEFTKELKDLDLRLCVWEYPLVSVHSPLFGELADKGWLLKQEDGQPYVYDWDPGPFGAVLTPLPPSGLVDFTNPEAYTWYGEAHQKLFDDGIDVIKTDFAEQVPDDARAANGDGGSRLHNVYPLLYNRCVYEASRQRFGDDALVWGRAGWTGSQRYPIQWGGDPQGDWEGLAASIRGGLSWGMSGAPFYSHDIGGFYGGDPDPELFLRWMQAGVLMSHCRFHGIGNRDPWAFGPEAEEIVRQWLDLRYRLIPYLEGCAEEAHRTGMPVMRAMPLAFPEDRASWSFEEQYMLGDVLLVMPVLRPGGLCRGYLPKGEWFDFWSGDAIPGGQVFERVVPLDQLPVFARSGTALPLGPAVRHTGEITCENHLERLRFFGLPRTRPRLRETSVTIEAEGGQETRIMGLPDSVGIETVGDVVVDAVRGGVVCRKP